MGAGLFHTLNIGSEALQATRQGVDTSGHNIANAQVEGYSRQRVNIKQRDPLQTHGGLLIGNGVYVGSITRAHDKFIENQLTKAHSDSGRASTRSEGMKQVELAFSPELGASVADETSKFFNSMEDLSNFPEDFVVRTSVVEAGRDLAASYRRVDGELKSTRAAFNERIQQITGDLTDKCREIADLNVKIQVTEAGEGEVANDLRDQRDRIIREVSGQIDIHYYEDKFGMMMLRGPNQVTLVDGGNSATLGVMRNNDNDGLYDVSITDWEQLSTRNVTTKLEGGALHALVQMRDNDLVGLIARNDEMANVTANAINGVHREGFGLKAYAEKTGRNFFKISDTVAGSAATIDIDDAIAESNDAIAAASSPAAPGDNVNANRIIKLKSEKLFGDEKVTLSEYYANYAGALGLDVVRANHVKEASDIMVQDLTSRRESVAGVSLDEEATNMLKWQANFTASSKVITTIDEMLDTVLNIKR